MPIASLPRRDRRSTPSTARTPGRSRAGPAGSSARAATARTWCRRCSSSCGTSCRGSTAARRDHDVAVRDHRARRPGLAAAAALVVVGDRTRTQPQPRPRADAAVAPRRRRARSGDSTRGARAGASLLSDSRRARRGVPHDLHPVRAGRSLGRAHRGDHRHAAGHRLGPPDRARGASSSSGCASWKSEEKRKSKQQGTQEGTAMKHASIGRRLDPALARSAQGGGSDEDRAAALVRDALAPGAFPVGLDDRQLAAIERGPEHGAPREASLLAAARAGGRAGERERGVGHGIRDRLVRAAARAASVPIDSARRARSPSSTRRSTAAHPPAAPTIEAPAQPAVAARRRRRGHREPAATDVRAAPLPTRRLRSATRKVAVADSPAFAAGRARRADARVGGDPVAGAGGGAVARQARRAGGARGAGRLHRPLSGRRAGARGPRRARRRPADARSRGRGAAGARGAAARRAPPLDRAAADPRRAARAHRLRARRGRTSPPCRRASGRRPSKSARSTGAPPAGARCGTRGARRTISVAT